MNKYQEQHYEDVAAIIRSLVSVEEGPGVPYPISQVSSLSLVVQFADLFTADNPRRCGYCNASETASPLHCTSPDAKHDYTEGFDRERFLKACGLES